jgi:two-component system OmpR family response regulator
MRNRRIVHDMADRPGMAFGRAKSSALAVAPARLPASSSRARDSQPVRRSEIPLEWSNVGELIIHMDGRRMLLRVALDEVSIKALLGAVAGHAGIRSPLRSTAAEVIDERPRSAAQTRLSFGSTITENKGSEEENPARRALAVVRVGSLEIDLLDQTAKRSGRTIDLRPREFRLLRYMMERSDRVLTRESLLRDVWNYKFVPRTNLVDVHMGRLRRKVDGPNEPAMIRSVRGAGFVLSATPLIQS